MIKGNKLIRIVAAVALPVAVVLNGCYSTPEQAQKLELRKHYFELKSKETPKQEIVDKLQEEKARLAKAPKKQKSLIESLLWKGPAGILIDSLKKPKTQTNDPNNYSENQSSGYEGNR